MVKLQSVPWASLIVIIKKIMDEWLMQNDLVQHKNIIESKWANIEDIKNSSDQEARYVVTLFPSMLQGSVHKAVESVFLPLVNVGLVTKLYRSVEASPDHLLP